jgi:hypothetical protein
MSDDEIALCLSFGVLGAPFLLHGSALVEDVTAVRVTYDLPIRLDEQTEAESERASDLEAAAVKSAEDVLMSLRLFKQGRVRLAGSVSFGESTGWARGAPALYGGGRPGDRYELSPEEASEFSAFHESVVRSNASNSKLAASARRFTCAGDRTRSDDEIVDLVVSAGASRRQVARFMKHAYDVRSTVVHGGALGRTSLKNLDGDVVEIGEFADVLEEIVRRSIKEVVRLVATGEVFPPDWDALLFPNRSAAC